MGLRLGLGLGIYLVEDVVVALIGGVGDDARLLQ